MSRNQITFFSGILLMVIPFSGFPHLWKIIIYLAIGSVLLFISILAYLRSTHSFHAKQRHMQDVYVENTHGHRGNRAINHEEAR